VLLFDIFHLFIDSAFRLICSLPLPLKVFWHDNNDFIQVFIIVPDVGETLHFRQQYLSKMGSFLTYLLNVGLKGGVPIWFKVSVRFGIINNTKNVRFGFSLSWFKGPCCVCQIWKILQQKLRWQVIICRTRQW
jgi:hypothetical protein